MDNECTKLCEAMNGLPGIQTIESCCGHGKDPYRIWFTVEGLEFLPDLLYWFDGCHCGCAGWRVFVKTDCAKSPACFVVEGPVGEQAYVDADKIAHLIQTCNE